MQNKPHHERDYVFPAYPLERVELLDALMLDSLPQAVPLARKFVTLALTCSGYEKFADIFQLLTSELVTNAVVHNRSRSAPPISVRLITRGHVIKLEVRDSEPSFPSPRTPRPYSENGRGLRVVEPLATEWGTEICQRTNVCGASWT